MKRDELERMAEKSLRYLHEGAVDHATLRAQADYLASWVKVVKAKCKAKNPGQSATAAEDAALRDPEYLAALEAQRQADQAWYEVQFKREAARAHLDAFQTVSANERVMA